LALVSSTPSLVPEALLALAAVNEKSIVPKLEETLAHERQRIQRARESWVQKGPPAVPSLFGDKETDEVAELAKRLESARQTHGSAAPKASDLEIVEDVDEASLETYATLLEASALLSLPKAKEWLTEASADSSFAVRSSALLGLTLFPDALSRVALGLKEPSLKLRTELAAALAKRGEEGQRLVVNALSASSDRRVLLQALAEFGAPENEADKLLAIFAEGSNDAPYAAQVLAKMGAKKAVKPLVESLSQPNSAGRPDVLVALGRLGDESTVEALSPELFHDVPEIRAAAASAILRLAPTKSAELLKALKNDYYADVREAAGEVRPVAAAPSTAPVTEDTR
jgi:hypothetical protein